MRQHAPSRASRFAMALGIYACLSLASYAEAHASVVMQQERYRFYTVFQFICDGMPSGSVYSNRPAQWLGYHWQSYDADGQLQATAKQVDLWRGRLFSSNTAMVFYDAADQPLGRLSGTLFTWDAGFFSLRNNAGTLVAILTVDKAAQSVVVRDPTHWLRATGRLARVQQATGGLDSWTIDPPAPIADLQDNASSLAIDARIWPLVATFFGTTWRNLVLDGTEG